MRQVLATSTSGAAVAAAFAHIGSVLRAGATPAALKRFDELGAEVQAHLDASDARIKALEDGILQVADELDIELDLTPAPAAAPGGDPSSQTGATAQAPAPAGDGVTTAAILPVDPTDTLRPGAGTSVSSPAPVAVNPSAEPVAEEAPQTAGATTAVVIDPAAPAGAAAAEPPEGEPAAESHS